MRARFLCSTLLLLTAVRPAAAQQPVALQFHGGLVTLRAQNAPVRTILAEWARLGGATIVNGDRVAGPPVTLELTGVPERQALDIVLRNVAGYMLAPRRAGASGPSAFDRVMILPTSVAPRTPPPTAASAAASARAGLARPPVLSRPPEPQESTIDMPQPEDGSAEEVQTPPPGVPVDPRRVPRPFIRRPLQPGTPPGANQEEPVEAPPTPAQGTVAPTPENPFGVPFGSSSMPGVVALPQRPQTQQAPANRVQ